jgi:transglutaminase-like putative cysteine protease
MHYTVRHVTRFTYDTPISESVMEVRMQPRSELCQRCLRFELSTSPRTSVQAYCDPQGNIIHHFDIPGRHSQLTLTAEAIVEFVGRPDETPVMTMDDWARIDETAATAEHWDYLHDSAYVCDTPRLLEFESSLGLGRRERDPMSTLRALTAAIRDAFDYRPQTTRVDSPIDEALESRAGVCQDFAHVMIALVRRHGIPCRYVSGYLFHGNEDRSVEGATHAWVEVLLPGTGWVGFDPTNNVLAGTRHIRVAVGRDYADVPPTRGVYKGNASDELSVSVQVSKAALPPSVADLLPAMTWSAPLPEPVVEEPELDHQQQQQQQQQ